MTGVEVRIRHEDALNGVRLCRVDLAEVDDVIPTLQRWGGVQYAGETFDDMTGAFFLDDDHAAYFEVILG